MVFEWDSVWGYLIVIFILAGLTLLRLALQQERWEEERLQHFLANTCESLQIALALVFFLIRPFVVHAFLIPSQSMEPTLLVGDRLLVNKFVFWLRRPHRQEVIVFRAPPLALQKSRRPDQKDYIKRLIGLPGDLVRVEQGRAFVNGEPLKEPYIQLTFGYGLRRPIFPDDFLTLTPWRDRYRHLIEWHWGKWWVRVPEGSYFVLGDNRFSSLDSRDWGFVPYQSLIGKALVRFWPPRRIGFIH